MYGFFDENISTKTHGESSGGFIESSMVVEEDEKTIIGIENNKHLPEINKLLSTKLKTKVISKASTSDNENLIQQHNNHCQLSELEEFLHCRGCNDNNQEMVAQNMSQSYNELFQTTQQPQEYLSLNDISPRIYINDHPHHQNITTLNATNNIYFNTQNEQSYHQQNLQQSQQRSYYNLSTLSNSANIYFMDIDRDDNSRVNNFDEQLLATNIPEPTLPPIADDIDQRLIGNIKQPDINIFNDIQIITDNNFNNKIIFNNNNSNNSCISNSNSNNGTNIINPDFQIDGNNYLPTNQVIQHLNNHLIVNNNVDNNLRSIKTPAVIKITEQSSSSSHRSHSSNQYHHNNYHHRRHVNQSVTNDKLLSVSSNTGSNDNYTTSSRKRKVSFHDEGDSVGDTPDDSKSLRVNIDNKKQNHSEIEKRRRDKMNTYIAELSAMIPMCHAMSRKLDKLTVLRMAVQHLKSILGTTTSSSEGNYKPSFLSDQELKTLILQAADGFVFVVGCDRGKILYVSASVKQTLNYTQDDLLGQSWFDILHPKDVAKVKEQLSSPDLSPREKFIDAKTMLPVKTDVPQSVSRLCSGARRSFFCRMKRKIQTNQAGDLQIKDESESSSSSYRRKKPTSDWKYSVIQCTGYLKSWASSKVGNEEPETGVDGETCNLSCLVAIGRVPPTLSELSPGPRSPKMRPIEFISRHTIDGKFLFVDQRATLVLGFLPQELLGTSMYEYYHHNDISHLAESHKAALQTSERITTQIYKFRGKDQRYIELQSEWKSFKNPWTKEIDYLIAKNLAIFNSNAAQCESTSQKADELNAFGNYEFFNHSNGSLERLISSHVEVNKIGRCIAEEVLDNQRRIEEMNSSVENSSNLTPDCILLNTDMNITSPVEINDTQLGLENVLTPDEGMLEMIGSSAMNESPNLLSTDGNDEAAMAVIMNLLEADAGLGGPIDFSGIPWPLP